MSIDEIEKYYSDNYDVVYDYAQSFENNDYVVYDCEKGITSKFVYIEDEKVKCRFCERGEPEVSFKKVAHAVSELLGNKRIISKNNECDECNSLFSEYEKDLTAFLLPYLIENGIRGKNGYRKYKTLDGKSYITYKDDLIKICEEEGFTRVSEDEEKHEIVYKYYSEGYRRKNIYKILVKIALSLLPEQKFKEFLIYSLLLKKDSKDTGLEKIRFTFYPGVNVFRELIVRGYLRKNDDITKPTYIFYFCFGNFSFQVPIFSDVDMHSFKKGEKITFDFWELDDLNQTINNLKPTTGIIDCKTAELVNKGFKDITFHYDEKSGPFLGKDEKVL